MKHYLTQLNPVLGFMHHGGGAGGLVLLLVLGFGVVAIAMFATMDKSK